MCWPDRLFQALSLHACDAHAQTIWHLNSTNTHLMVHYVQHI
jgi:hypothetical protein